MAILDHDSFMDELSHLLSSHPSELDLPLARSALMLLSVAQRPLRAHEIWIALQIDASKDTGHIERLLSDSAYMDDQEAAASLRKLLGSLISTKHDSTDPARSKVYVTLCDPELRTFLNHMGGLGLPDSMLSFGFSTSQAHRFAASVCMVICSLTTLHLAHVHDETIASSLVLYAWAHWNAHLELSGDTLENENAAGLADQMMHGVCTDVLVLLLALNDFLTGPIAILISHDRTQGTALVKKTQTALARQLQLLGVLVQHGEFCKSLQTARQVFEASRKTGVAPGSQTSMSTSITKVRSGMETLKVDRVLNRTETLFDEGTRTMVSSFADMARGLRSLAVLLARPPLYEELLREYSIGCTWSPLDILVNAANWMEIVASYPFWGEVPTAGSSNPLIVTDTNDPNYEAALLVLSRLRKDGAPPPRKESDLVSSQLVASGSRKATNLELEISSLHWNAARLVYKLKSLPSRGILGATFTINDPRRLHARRTSSFASFPIEMTGNSSATPASLIEPLDKWFGPSSFLIPQSQRRFHRRRITPLLDVLSRSSFAVALDAFSAGAFSGTQADNWLNIKAALLADGYRAALALLLTAGILHQIRRMLFPWMGQWMWYRPLDDLRLALSNPDVFLEQSLAYTWGWALISYAQKWLFDVAGAILAAVVALAGEAALSNPPQRIPGFMLEASRSQYHSNGGTGSLPESVVLWMERVTAAGKVGYLVWVLSTAEYIFGRGVNTVSWVIAYYKLLAGGDAEHIALGNALKENWTKVPLTLWQFLYYLKGALWPLIWGSVVCAIVGQPGLLILVLAVVGVVTALTKYRSTFYIALEVSGMFVFGGLLLLTVALMALDFYDDPMGLDVTTGVARKMGNQARRVLPQGAGSRIQILRRKAALPVTRAPPSSSAIARNDKPVAGGVRERQD
ncbi:hypothetical protein N656DRAFT_779282 [Canariomyces notabilis]|uniref:Uncharacterized protein n=1 Tax=Canariomyces notabilis TaxID=2074819 RepID=A0AAN6TDH8_9PEZI|nr:hypothetical protein N656DRAFT_779282 [Canariomyces arenarius]